MDNELYCPMKMTAIRLAGAYARKKSALGGTNLVVVVPFGGLRGRWTTSK